MTHDAQMQRLETRATWDDLGLPAGQTALLHRIAEQALQSHAVDGASSIAVKPDRGPGISALFAGTGGTGKTRAAEVIANHMHRDLYRIDLSALAGKYIGETEKNLRRVFDAAEESNPVLFFDEADALFGKRTDVKDSHDRYANVEIDYLLARIEAYRGLAILASNMKNAIDPGFLRRLRFVVDFS